MNSEPSDAFIERLKLLVGQQSVRSFAAKVGVSHSVMYQYLSGKSDPTRKVMEAITSACGVRMAWLASGEGPMRDEDAAKPASPEAYDPEIVHSVAWFLAQRRGDAPKVHADLFVALCDYLRDHSSESDMSKVADIIDFTLRRGQK